MLKILFGTAQINWCMYPEHTKPTRMVISKNKYLITLYNQAFPEIDVVDYAKGNYPIETAHMIAVPPMGLQINYFLQAMFPRLLQDYVSIYDQISSRPVEQQTQLMQGVYRVRISEYEQMIRKLGEENG